MWAFSKRRERERKQVRKPERMDRKISMIDRYGRLSRQRRKPPYSCVEYLTTVGGYQYNFVVVQQTMS